MSASTGPNAGDKDAGLAGSDSVIVTSAFLIDTGDNGVTSEAPAGDFEPWSLASRSIFSSFTCSAGVSTGVSLSAFLLRLLDAHLRNRRCVTDRYCFRLGGVSMGGARVSSLSISHWMAQSTYIGLCALSVLDGCLITFAVLDGRLVTVPRLELDGSEDCFDEDMAVLFCGCSDETPLVRFFLWRPLSSSCRRNISSSRMSFFFSRSDISGTVAE